MKIYDVDLNAKYHVKFPDAEKTISYFIDGKWKETFYTFSDLSELASHLIMGFHHESPAHDFINKQNYKFIEGFNHFNYDEKTDTWISTDEVSGIVIIISLEEELDIEYCQEKE